ncbi:MAG TPA: VapC toxin family PIN domain ribonuclease [Deltaproteobacteria bacterium]|nr:VapC toxin family PIN domain ribonuclease [Deltaproteobacteria bacterium]
MTLFLDACVVIYWIESHASFYAKFLKTLQKLRDENPSASFAVSRLSWLECRVKPLQEKNRRLLELYSNFFSMEDLKIIELDADVVGRAVALRADYGLRTPDAFQAASALTLEEELLFLTSDKAFRKVPELRVITF